ncbi:MAG: glucoamylase family protein, partial [Casimicrobiaceae bacterium]
VASLPFAPEIVIPTLDHFEALRLRANNPYGFKATFNATFTQADALSQSWISPFHCGLNQGPIVMMIENYRSSLVWNLMRECPYLVAGLKRAGFQGGWLDHRDGAVRHARAYAETDSEHFEGKATQ